MKRRVTILFLSLMMVLSISVPSFAATDENSGSKVKVPEAIALVTVENIDCILLNEIGDKLNVKISFKNGDSIAEIPVIRVKEGWRGYGGSLAWRETGQGNNRHCKEQHEDIADGISSRKL